VSKKQQEQRNNVTVQENSRTNTGARKMKHLPAETLSVPQIVQKPQ
jgi:hypothetical protein